MSDLAESLNTAADITKLVAAAPGPIGMVAKIATLALKAGAGFAAAGKDPVIEIQRVLSSKAEVDEVHSDWDRWIKDNFPDTERPEPTPFEKRTTDPSMPAFADPYED